MLFKFRKIAILALCLVLVCGISAAAFAATPPYSASVSYSDGSYAESYAELLRYGTRGYTDAAGMADTATAHVSMSCVYIDGDLVKQTDAYGLSEPNTALVSVYDENMFSMVEAAYEFWAMVPTYFGTQYFEPSPVVLEY